LAPPGPKNLTPLSEAGLCEAVITAPSAAPPRLTARETAGVGTTPTATGRAPRAFNPAPSARASAGPEALVSRPMTALPERTPRDSSQRAAAAPIPAKKASFTTGPP